MQKDITDVVCTAGARERRVAAGIREETIYSQVGGISGAIASVAELQGENGWGEYGLLENRVRGWWGDLH